MDNWKDDPENYNKLIVPHESKEKVQESLDAFFAKVSAARKEHKIADILVVVKDSLVYDSGEIGTFLFHSQYGNMLNGVEMAAYVYGKLQAEQRERINKLMAGKE